MPARGAGDHGAGVLELRLPAELLARFGAVRDQPRRIAGTARPFVVRDRSADRLLDRVDDLADRETVAGAQVPGTGPKGSNDLKIRKQKNLIQTKM